MIKTRNFHVNCRSKNGDMITSRQLRDCLKRVEGFGSSLTSSPIMNQVFFIKTKDFQILILIFDWSCAEQWKWEHSSIFYSERAQTSYFTYCFFDIEFNDLFCQSTWSFLEDIWYNQHRLSKNCNAVSERSVWRRCAPEVQSFI